MGRWKVYYQIGHLDTLIFCNHNICIFMCSCYTPLCVVCVFCCLLLYKASLLETFTTDQSRLPSLNILVYLSVWQNHGNPTSHKPELVLNNFTTRLGHRVGRWFKNMHSFYKKGRPHIHVVNTSTFPCCLFRMIQSLFPQDPNFRGRRVVTFHNQRDYIFFRHHRWIYMKAQ